MGEVLEKLRMANKNNILKITTLEANQVADNIKVTSDGVDGGYMLDALLLQQSDLGFSISELEINAKNVVGTVKAILEDVVVSYSWDNKLGLWCV